MLYQTACAIPVCRYVGRYFMNPFTFQVCFLTLLSMVCCSIAQPVKETDRLHEFKRKAAQFNSVISLPQFEMTTNEVRVSVKQTIAVGNAALDRIGALKPREVTFQNT